MRKLYRQHIEAVIKLRLYSWQEIGWDVLGMGFLLWLMFVLHVEGHQAWKDISSLPVFVAVMLFGMFRVVSRLHARILVVRS